MDNPIIVGESTDPLDAFVEDIDRESFPEQYPDEEPEQKAAEEPEAEAESEPEAEPEEPEYVEITYKGKPVKLTADEVLEHASKGFDYTQKTMELAEQRRTLESKEQQLQQQYQLQQQNLQGYAQLMSMDAQLEQYQNVNWEGWIDQDPIEAQKAWQKYQMLQNRRQEAAINLSANQQRLTSEQNANLQRQLADGAEQLKREIKGWSSDLAKELTTTGVSVYGFTEAEMGTIYDPRMVKVLHDAYQWQKLQAAKPQTLKKVTDAPKAAKPNSKTVDAQAKRGQLMKQLKQAKSAKNRAAIADSLLDAYV